MRRWLLLLWLGILVGSWSLRSLWGLVVRRIVGVAILCMGARRAL